MLGLTEEKLATCPACGARDLRTWDSTANLERCVACGTVFDNPRPDAAGIEAFYARFGQYDHWLEDLPGREQVWRRRLSVIRRFAGPGRILDIGAGIGQFLDLARKEGFSIDGVELSPRGCTHARERFGVELRQGRLEDFEFPDSSFDVITLFHVLEHVPDPRGTLATCHRLLSPGGLLVVAVPNEIESITSRIHRLKRIMGFPCSSARGVMGVKSLVNNPNLDEVHLSRFTQGTLRSLFARNGFDVLHLGIDRHLPETGLGSLPRMLNTRVLEALHVSTGLLLHPTMIACARKTLAA